MVLTVHERERWMIVLAARLAEQRTRRGLPLNLAEAAALITSSVLAGARDGPLPMVVDDVVVGVYGLAQDIGDRVRTHRALERARAEAEAANELKSVFVANVNHEIRTPLTSVLAATEMLGDTDLDALQQQLLDRADRSGRRLLRLVDNLLDFSELESGRASVVSEAYDPRALVADVNGWAERLAADKHLTYTCQVIAPPGACLTGDTAKITQLLRTCSRTRASSPRAARFTYASKRAHRLKVPTMRHRAGCVSSSPIPVSG